ncbi:dicarboxylate/amino acid:cation symporter [Sphingomonas sp. MMS24-JH45]
MLRPPTKTAPAPQHPQHSRAHHDRSAPGTIPLAPRFLHRERHPSCTLDRRGILALSARLADARRLRAGLAAGLVVNLAAGDAAWIAAVTKYVTGPFGQIFLRLLFMLVIPSLFSALVTGVAEMKDLAALKRIGLRTLFFTFVLSAISVVVALALVNATPGAGIDPALAKAMLAQASEGAGAILKQGKEQPGALDSILAIVPENPVRAAADGDILAFMVFALAIGIGLVLVQNEKTAAFERGIEGLLEVTMRLIGLVIRLAPIAVACFMFNLTALFGVDLRSGWAPMSRPCWARCCSSSSLICSASGSPRERTPSPSSAPSRRRW